MSSGRNIGSAGDAGGNAATGGGEGSGIGLPGRPQKVRPGGGDCVCHFSIYLCVL